MVIITWICDTCGCAEALVRKIGDELYGPDGWQQGCFGKDKLECVACHKRSYDEYLIAHPGAIFIA